MICRNNSNILKHFENFLKKYLLFLRTYSIILKYHTDGQLVKRLRRRPLTAETGVRFPYWLLNVFIYSPTHYSESMRFGIFLRSGMFLLLLIETESTNGEVGVGDRERKSDALSIVDEIAGLIK